MLNPHLERVDMRWYLKFQNQNVAIKPYNPEFSGKFYIGKKHNDCFWELGTRECIKERAGVAL